MEQDFDLFFRLHEGRIHYQIKRLNVGMYDYGAFYSEGILALWRAYKGYEHQRGEIGTYVNYMIRYRLIDLIRKKVREDEVMENGIEEWIITLDDGNKQGTLGIPVVDAEGIILENEAFWREVKKSLSLKQWKWVHYFVIANLSLKEIAEIENVSVDAVKGWARAVREKLNHPYIKSKLESLL